MDYGWSESLYAEFCFITIGRISYALKHTQFSLTSLKSSRRFLRSPIVFFNPVIPTQNFVQSRNPEGYFWHPTSQPYFKSRNSPRFCFQIPNPELQVKEISDPEKLVGDPPFWPKPWTIKAKFQPRSQGSVLPIPKERENLGTRLAKPYIGFLSFL